MKQNREDWTDAVRRSLDGAQAPLPRGGWECIERDLADAVPAVSGVRKNRVWLKFAAAAAAVLVCVSVGIRVVRSDKNVLKRVVTVSEAAVSEQITDAEGFGASAPGDMIASLREPAVMQDLRGEVVFVEPRTTQTAQVVVSASAEGTAAGVSASTPTPEAAAISEPEAAGTAIRGFAITTTPEPDVATVPESEPVAAATPESVSPAPADPEFTPAPSASRTEARPRYNTADYDGLFASVEPERKGGSVGLSAGGIVTSASGGGMGSNYTSALITDDAASVRYAYSDYSYDHKQPLSFGVSFRKELGHGFSAESGVVYTLLRSSVAIPGATNNVRQSLHFIGIPLRVNWEFLRRGGFSLYVGAGGQVDKCVSARFGGERITEKGVQWSVFGAVGAQYRLGKTVGIYFEPSVSHYLTHTTLRTPYTDSPVNLNLQLGVRFNY